MDENSIRWRIKMYCKLRGISLNQLESDCGLGKGYVSKLDKSNPNINKLKVIADYLKVDLNSLVYGASKDTNGKVSSDGTSWYFSDDTARLAQEIHDKPHLHALLDAERDLSPDAARALKDFIYAQYKREGGRTYAE